MRTQFWAGSQTAPSTSAQNFGALVQAGRGFLATESGAQQVCSVAGTLHSFRVRITTAPGSGKQWTFTIRKNGVDTSLSLVISGTATTGFIISPVTIAAGDLLSLSITPSGTPTLPGVSSWASSFDSDSPNQSPLLSCTFGSNMNVSNSANSVPVQGTNASTTTAANADGICPVAGSITGFRVRFPSAVSAGSWQVILVKNGVDTGMTATITGGAQTATSSGSAVSLAAGDLIRFRVPGSSTPTAQGISIGATFAPTTDGESFFIGGQFGTMSNTSSLFWYVGPSPDSGNSGAINRHSLSNACTLTAIWAQAKTAPVGGDSWTFAILQNEVSVASVQTTSGSVVSTTGLTIAIADADRMSMQHTPAGTPNSSVNIWSVAIFNQPGAIITNESGEASAATGFFGYQGDATTNESGEASALSGFHGFQGPASTNESGEASAATGSFGYEGAAATNESGESSAADGITGYAATVQTDSGGLTTDGVGSTGFEGSIETESAGLTTLAAGGGVINGVAQTESGGLTTDGAGDVSPPVIQPPPEPLPPSVGGPGRAFGFPLPQPFRPMQPITGTIETDSAGITTHARGRVGRPPRPQPRAKTPRPDKTLRIGQPARKAKASKRRSPAKEPVLEPITGTMATFSGPIQARAKGVADQLTSEEITALLSALV